jgi:hypothetical protein
MTITAIAADTATFSLGFPLKVSLSSLVVALILSMKANRKLILVNYQKW